MKSIPTCGAKVDIELTDMPFTTSSPNKKPGPDDSGVSVHLSEMSHTSSTDSELDHLNPDKTITIDMDEDDNICEESQSVISVISNKFGPNLKKISLALIALLYLGYYVKALVISGMGTCGDDHNVWPLSYLTIFALLIVLCSFIKAKFSDDINTKCLNPLGHCINNQWFFLKWLIVVAIICGILTVIVLSAVQRPSNLISLVGWLFFFFVLLLFSKAPRKVKWRPVFGGFALQFFFATFILKWSFGFNLFNNLGEMFRHFLSYSEFGAKFVLGKLDDHIFAFKVLPVIIFFSCVITMLYYMGIMQCVIGKIAFVMRVTLGTTAAESLCAAGNIFVGQTEAPIMIRPFLALMTLSELHAVMVGGFSTIAGAVLAAYIMKGVPATHLLTASVMNAPTALAVSKILYPELGKSKIAKMQEAINEKQPYRNVIEAAAAGASAAISLVANVAANLIAFVALLSFMNGAISWFGSFVCYPELSFEMICHYALMPVAYLMGVRWEDAGEVAKLIGIKTFLNEFYAYDLLSEMRSRRLGCQLEKIISVRSEIISTYALCGFANLSSIGIQLGGLGPMAPNRIGDLAQIAVSALLGGILTNLMTACVAGLLVVESPFEISVCTNSTNGHSPILNITGNSTIGFSPAFNITGNITVQY